MTDKGIIERHPFTPFLPEGCKVVLCGTFPPKQEKWSMDFFYPNFYNDMWRIFGLIFFNDKDRFFDKERKEIDKDAIQKMLTRYKIGIGETVKEAIRTKDNASDKYLEIVTPVDLTELLQAIPECDSIVTTGEKAASIISTLTGTSLPKMGEATECCISLPDDTQRRFKHWRMPSTSRAYPMKLDLKKDYYKAMFEKTGII